MTQIPKEVKLIMRKNGYRNCWWCGDFYKPVRKGQKFDSPACRTAHWRAGK